MRDSHRNLESGATKITTTPGRHSRFGSASPSTKWDEETHILLPQKTLIWGRDETKPDANVYGDFLREFLPAFFQSDPLITRTEVT